MVGITFTVFWLFFLLCRFCLSETSCPQEDNYPNSLCIKVNGKLFPLPVSDFFSQTYNTMPIQLKCSVVMMLKKHFISLGVCTSAKKWCGTEETGKTSKHYLPCPSLFCSTKSNFSDMGTRNWKSKNINANIITCLKLSFQLFL